jgi:hypothetical protein
MACLSMFCDNLNMSVTARESVTLAIVSHDAGAWLSALAVVNRRTKLSKKVSGLRGKYMKHRLARRKKEIEKKTRRKWQSIELKPKVSYHTRAFQK